MGIGLPFFVLRVLLIYTVKKIFQTGPSLFVLEKRLGLVGHLNLFFRGFNVLYYLWCVLYFTCTL